MCIKFQPKLTIQYKDINQLSVIFDGPSYIHSKIIYAHSVYLQLH